MDLSRPASAAARLRHVLLHDMVLLASVGAGFTVGATLLRWEF